MSFGSLGISISGMQSAQVGMDVTANNIANANTEGYTRKQVTFEEGVPGNAGASKVVQFSGVVVDQINRIRNSFLDQQVRTQSSNAGQDKIVSDLMIQMNDILGEPSEFGLTAKLNEFYEATSDWSANPESTTARTVFVNSAIALTESFNQIDSSIGILKDNLEAVPTGEIQTTINGVNEMLEELAEVHSKTLIFQAAGQSATDLEDTRDLLLDKLSEQLNLTIVKEGNGNFSKLTMDAHASEAVVTSSTGFPNYNSAISGITSGANTLTLSVNNGSGTSVGPFTINFEDSSSIRDVVEKINDTFKSAGGSGHIASLNSTGQIVMQTSTIDNATNNTNASIAIDSSSTALSVLGLSSYSGVTTSGTNAETYTLVDNIGMHYRFDFEPGANNVGINPNKLTLKTNDSLLTKVGTLDSFTGEIGGYFQATNEDIPELRKQLDDFAMSLKDSINDILSLGQVSSGAAGATLFTGSTASDFSVGTDVVNNNSILASGETGAASDGSIIAEVADLFFGNNNIVSDKSRSEKVYIDSSSTSNTTSSIPIIPGETITVHADGIIKDGGLTGSDVNAGTNGFGSGSLVQIEFIDASGAVVGSAVDFPSSAGAPEDRVSYSGAVPSNAAFVRFKMNGSSFNDNDLTDNEGHFGISVIQGTESDADSNFNNKISNIVGEFGTRGNAATSRSDNSANLYNSLNDRRLSISGVSIEEETGNLILFQNAFAANARVMSAIDESIQAVLQIL